MNYGFVIDNSRCIGCHACSTACKSENEVPLGVSRTWVKYVETGAYPDTRRHFQVTRCNHCANPPCVRICPTQAMYQRADGIVEFDNSACIGCKACMQACPYDAIHIDPETNTAAKCHYCAHRVELNLEPACVVVCPEHAILAGDLDDPDSEISRKVARADVVVRKPEQGTAPKLFYIHGNDAALNPTTVAKPDSFMWADVVKGHHHQDAGLGPHAPAQVHEAAKAEPLPGGVPVKTGKNGQAIRAGQPQGAPWKGPIQIGQGKMAEQMVQVAYNAQHKVPWHWPVPAYLVTKGIAAGIFLLMAAALALAGWQTFDQTLIVVAGGVSVLFSALTAALLVYDLERPDRFLYILLRPQWRSWLARGAILLIGFSTIGGLWFAAELFGALGVLDMGLVIGLRPWLLIIGAPFAVGAAIYTAFLFGQAEGRDLWQSSLLPVHLIVQATMAGAGALLLTGAIVGAGPRFMAVTTWIFGGFLVLDLAVTFLGELGMSHASEIAARAAHEITHGKYKTMFWGGAVVLGHLIPLALLFAGPGAAAVGGVLALVGLYFYEHAYVMAPQEVPNS